VADNEIHEPGFGKIQQVSGTGEKHVLDGHFLANRGQGVSDVLHHHDGARTGIDQLVLEFARRIEGVGVDDREAGAQRAEQSDRVLQQVGQHDGHPVSVLQPPLLQRGCEVPAQSVEVGIAQRFPQADKRLVLAEPIAALFKHIDNGSVFGEVNVSGHIGRVVLQPGLSIHERIFRELRYRVTEPKRGNSFFNPIETGSRSKVGN
jgi:hypothetical protein